MIKLFLPLFLVVSMANAGTGNLKMNFVTIKAKTFLMGSADSENGRNFDESLHFVTISKDFEIQTKTITQSQWVEIMGSNPSEFKNQNQCKKDFKMSNGISMCANHPVESVSFSAVTEFIKKLNAKDSTYNYRLPTEAEWELAARGGTGTSYFFSDDGTGFEKYIVYDANSTSKVGVKLPNQFGLYDMFGNVSQWVSDYYDQYPQIDPENSTVDPTGPEKGDYRVVRGSHWEEYRWNFFRSAARDWIAADETNSHVGFRLVRIKK